MLHNKRTIKENGLEVGVNRLRFSIGGGKFSFTREINIYRSGDAR